MFVNAARNGLMDRIAIAVSGLCVVHCLASAVFVTLLASAGGLLVSPVIHEVGLTIAIMLGRRSNWRRDEGNASADGT